MKVFKFLIIFLISTIAFTQIPQSLTSPINYKQGIYDVSEYKGFNATAKLLTPDNVTSLIIVDAYSNEKFYKRFDTIDEVITLGYIKDGDYVVIAGTGELSLSFSK